MRFIRGSQTLPGRMVWAHSTHHGQADYTEDGVPRYGESWPLLLKGGGWSSWNSAKLGDRMQEVVDAGIDALQVLIYDYEPGANFLTEFMPEAANVGLKLAPCYMGTSGATLANQINTYITQCGSSPAAAKEDDKFLVWLYAAHDIQDLDVTFADPRIAGKFVIVGDLMTAASQRALDIDEAALDGHAKRYRAVWNFEDSTSLGTVMQQVVDYCRTRILPFAGGVMPGYNRENPSTGGFIDPRGTKQLREQWAAHLSYPWIRWVTLVTWQDYSEGHTIRPSSDWHFTRADVCRWYADELKGVAHPTTPQLYVTAPTHIHQGEKVQAEALVLNGSSSPATVTIDLLNPSGAVVSSASSTVLAGKAGDVTSNDSLSGVSWVRPRAKMVVDGVTTTVTGAPVLIYAAGVKPTDPDRRRYNSISQRKAGSHGATLTKSGGKATLTTTSAQRTLEVLQNTRSAGRGYATASYAATVPMAAYEGVGGQSFNAASTGWIIGRVVGTDGSISYTDPVAL